MVVEAQIYRFGKDFVKIQPTLSGKAMRSLSLSKFYGAMSLDTALGKYLSDVNHGESSYSPEFVEVVGRTIKLIKFNLFDSYVDLLAVYNKKSRIKRWVENAFVKQRRYLNGEIEECIFGGEIVDPGEIQEFVNKQMSISKP